MDKVKKTMRNILAIVVPCYEEEMVLHDTAIKLSAILSDLAGEGLISPESFILCVDDGSKDRTWQIIKNCHSENQNIKGVNLATNVGHQNALWAGLQVVKEYADMIVSIDADLQDDVNAIKNMVRKYHEGFDIIYGVRNERKKDSIFKRNTALAFYKLMDVMGTKTVYNHADFRLMSKRAVEHLLLFNERNLYIRGLVPLIGYKSDNVFYNREERIAGESKYSFGKMLGLAIDGITSFSIKPIRMISLLGVIFILIATCVLFWTLFSYMQGLVVPGWSSLMISLWFCTGCVLFALGVIGEYVGKCYIESKHRPRYNIESVLL